jgi:Arc/MetJ-type ribon-helix-helix transcriptional regulator
MAWMARAPEVDTRRQNPYRWGLEVDLTPDQTAFIQQAIDAGRLHRPEEAVREALSLWEEPASVAAPKFLPPSRSPKPHSLPAKAEFITEDSMRQLADEVKQRGRARLAAEQQTSR